MRLSGWLAAAALLRVALLLWGAYQDAHSPVKYTDVDYLVFSDAALCLARPTTTETCSHAQGPLAPTWLGDPYARATYRYTPLVALALVPNLVVHPVCGKLLFALCDLVVGALLHTLLVRRGATERYAGRAVAAAWLVNPIVANISTRGSSEAFVGALVVSTLSLADQARWDAAAAVFGVAVHVKIFPFLYGSSLVAALAASARGDVALALRRMLRFGTISFSCFMGLNGALYLLCVLALARLALALSRSGASLAHALALSCSRGAAVSASRSSKRRSSTTSRASTTATTSRPTSTPSTCRPLLPPLRPRPPGSSPPGIRSPPSCRSSSSRSGSAPCSARRTCRSRGSSRRSRSSRSTRSARRRCALSLLSRASRTCADDAVCTQYFLWYLWLLPAALPSLSFSPRHAILVGAVWVLTQVRPASPLLLELLCSVARPDARAPPSSPAGPLALASLPPRDARRAALRRGLGRRHRLPRRAELGPRRGAAGVEAAGSGGGAGELEEEERGSERQGRVERARRVSRARAMYIEVY